MLAALASILLSRSVKSSTASTNGLPMLDFRPNLLSLEASGGTPVLFGTAVLSGLSLFATARAHRCDGAALRVHAGAADVSN